MSGRIAGWIVFGVTAVIVVYAWIDGGEEQLHVIREPLALEGEPA